MGNRGSPEKGDWVRVIDWNLITGNRAKKSFEGWFVNCEVSYVGREVGREGFVDWDIKSIEIGFWKRGVRSEIGFWKRGE
jgi:hypothetical protein